MNKLGEKVKHIRNERGISADKLAELIGKTGTNRSQYIYDLEGGRIRRIDLGTLKKVANALKVDSSEFITDDFLNSNGNNQSIIDVKNMEINYQEKYIKLLEEYKKLQSEFIDYMRNK